MGGQVGWVPDHVPEVLVAGRYYADVIFRGLSGSVVGGTEVFADGLDLLPGGAFTPAMALRRLGHRVLWAADFGTDVFSQLVLSAARVEGLDETCFRHHPGPLRSVSVALSGSGDRALISYQDAVDERPLALLVREYRPRVLLLPLLRFDAATRAGLRVARRCGTEVFMDCQDVAGTVRDPMVRDTLALVDVFAPNAAEALRLTATTQLDEALEILTGLVDTVIIKRGASGAVAVAHGLRCDVPAIPLEVVDTTGAGDCFNVGFLHARLAGGSLLDCVTAAVACGGRACSGSGSSAAPDPVELRRWSARVPPGRVASYLPRELATRHDVRGRGAGSSATTSEGPL